MKLRLLLLAAFCALFATSAKAEEDLYAELFDEMEEIDDVEDIDRALEELKRLQEEERAKWHEREREEKLAAELALIINDHYNYYNEEALDPCRNFPCGAGKVCVLEANLPKCICIQECPEENDARRLVCTNRNETWASDCEVYRQNCLCSENDPGCKNVDFKHIHIDYYGECKILPRLEKEREEKRAAVLDLKIDDIYNYYNEEALDPCRNFPCGAGKVCVLEANLPKCICIQECPEENDARRLVCTNRNETWASDCEVYRQNCLCSENDPGCKNVDFKHIYIDYYGECKILPPCTEEEKSDFPRRMRDWLFTIMRDLAERHILEDNILALEQEAETNMTRRWANAAIWKWCDLDGEPNDRSVSRHELFPIRAPLLSLEHCIAPFFESCDSDNDHRITLKEWGQCLEINEEDMIDRCDEISSKNLHFATG